jgi:hypothetical protein
MRLSRFIRRFSDVWGNKYGNAEGSVIRWQYNVGKTELRSFSEGGVSKAAALTDRTKSIESAGRSRFIFTTQHNPERLRR